jgi:hypothetical protein
MPAHLLASPRWTTSSFSSAADTTPAELSALGAHVGRCRDSRSRWFALRCAADVLHGFIAGRMMTTLLIAGIVIGASAAIL